MAKWYRISRSILRFDDTITLYQKHISTETIGGIDTETETWERTVINGVQWVDHYDKQNESGKISVARYVSITFPKGTYTGLVLDAAREEDAIVYGEVTDTVTGARGNRISDLLERYPKSGRIKSVNDNTNRRMLKNIKVVIG